MSIEPFVVEIDGVKYGIASARAVAIDMLQSEPDTAHDGPCRRDRLLLSHAVLALLDGVQPAADLTAIVANRDGALHRVFLTGREMMALAEIREVVAKGWPFATVHLEAIDRLLSHAGGDK